MVEVKQSAELLGFANGSYPATHSLVGEENDILKSLMISLALMMGKILVKRVVQGTFAEENQLVETLVFH